MTDARKYNRPPPHQRALDAEALAAMHSMLALGVPQTRIAQNLGVDVRTVAAAVHRRGAYVSDAGVAKLAVQQPVMQKL